jgi:hypothetical protein
MKFNLDQLLAEFDLTSLQYAEAAAQCSQLKEWRKIVKATQMRVAESAGHTTLGAMEREALCSPEYQQAVTAYSAAEKNMLEFKMRLRSIEKQIDAWRTQESSARLERKSYDSGAHIL